MLAKIQMPSEKLIAFEAKGKVTSQDYRDVLFPLVNSFASKNEKIRFLYYLGPDYEGFTVGAGWEDLKLGLNHMNSFEKFALVTDVDWIRNISKFFSALIPCPFKIFKNAELFEAKKWLVINENHLHYDFDKEHGLLQLDVSTPLCADDFMVVSKEVDPWINRVGKLNGILLHTEKFPGWENLSGFFSHLSFVKHHHKKVDKIAVCANGIFPEMGSRIGKHFVHPEIKHFAFDHVDEAKRWIINQ